ncbi:MAG: hypothetical protein RL329_2109 [Bacteroidota bacterium]|jgi:hypothetical protein
MQYRRYYTIEKTDKSIERVQLGSSPTPLELLQLAPACKAVCFDIYNYNNMIDGNYLNELFETLQSQLEIFYLKRARIENVPQSLWHSGLKEVHLNCWHQSHLRISLPYLFENQLESITIKAFNQDLPPALFHSKKLKTVFLSGISTGYEGLFDAENLETLIIYDYSKTTLEIPLHSFKKLKHLELNRCNLEILPDLSACTQLETLILTQLTRLQNLEIPWNALKNLQRLELNHVAFSKRTNLIFKELPKLKIIHIISTNLFLTKSSLGKMPALQVFACAPLNLKQFPKKLLQSPTLQRLFLQDCPHLAHFPITELEYPLLSALSILKCPHLELSNKILIPNYLTKLNYDFNFFKKSDLGKTHFKSHLMDLISDWSVEDRLDLGSFLLEGKGNFKGEILFKTLFLKLLHHEKASVRNLFFEHFHLLQSPEEQPLQWNHYQGKSIAFLGNPKFDRKIYIQKIILLNMDYHAIAQANTDWIIVCEGAILPNHFWDHPHFFLTERDLNLFLATVQPNDFEETNLLDNLRRLLGSNEATNYLLILELLESNGLPETFLPDLMMLPYTSDNQLVKHKFENILQAQLPPKVYKAFLQPFEVRRKNPFKAYETFAPDFEIDPLIYSYAKLNPAKHKMGRGDLMHSFFQLPMSLQHPFRAELFQERFKKGHQLLNRDNLHFAPYLLTTDEIYYLLENCPILSEIRGLSVHCADLLLPKFWEKSTFHRLRIRCYLPDMSDYLSHFEHLEMLYIWNDQLKTFPISILKMRHLRRFRIFTKTPLTLPPDFEAFARKLYTLEMLPQPIS